MARSSSRSDQQSLLGASQRTGSQDSDLDRTLEVPEDAHIFLGTEVRRRPKPCLSTTMLLTISSCSFSCFAAAQLTAALVGHSLSLLGDAVTMIVDSITYMLNLYAEKRKKRSISAREVRPKA